MSDKCGSWCKNPDVVKTWTKADYLINNREIVFSPGQIFPLKHLTSNKNNIIVLVLYALCDLTWDNNNKTNRKDYFNIKEIVDTINSRLKKYKLYLKVKGNAIIERINYNKSQKILNMPYNVSAIIEREKNELSQYLDKFAKSKRNVLAQDKIRKDDVYYGLAILTGVFVNFKVYTKKGEYNEYTEEPTNSTRILYYLSPSGKTLMEKIKKELYLI